MISVVVYLPPTSAQDFNYRAELYACATVGLTGTGL